ncbi:MAG: phosphoenolpyruvate--protein phosphotransferase [Minwuia sp.]|nr:phosphoenolpyruvate--protein phosphotransferase [Minwuia sp.]
MNGLPENALSGLGVADGIAIGPAHVVEGGVDRVLEFRISAGRIPIEIERFQAATVTASQQLERLREQSRRIGGGAGEEMDYLLSAHASMLAGSRLTRGVEQRIRDRRINAEAAVQREIAAIVRQFKALSDPYLAARADDVRDLGRRLIRALGGERTEPFADITPGSVVVAREITPADMAAMEPGQVTGLAAEIGGADGHTAIMARGLGISAVLGVPDLVANIRQGDQVIIDGQAGIVIVRPDKATIDNYRRQRTTLLRRRRALAKLKDLPSETRDGVAVHLQANVELPIEAEQALGFGAEGIGLLRSEFQFMAAETEPDEDCQYEQLASIVRGMDGRPVTIRTLDVGFDKLPPSMVEGLPPGDNPALGLRAIRLSLLRPALLETQLAAILRAANHGPVRILLPMITTVSEIVAVRAAMVRVARKLKRRKVDIPDPLPPLGVMIEVPAAALSADALARVCDFFSIGTNDLTMYTLALDRTNEQVASLYDPLHPGVLRLMQFAVAAALRAGIPVNVCGEMAGDPRFAPLLIGLGIRDLSMAVGSIPLVKQRIRRLDTVAAAEHADMVMAQTDPARSAELLDAAP